MTDSKKSQPISPSSIARIAGNILSGMVAASPNEFFKIGDDECEHAMNLARYIAKKAEEQSE